MNEDELRYESDLPLDPLGHPASWAAIELRIRKVLDEFRVEFIKEVYTRSIDPLAARIEHQEQQCSEHSQTLSVNDALLKELTDAKLIRRVEVAESKLRTYGAATIVLGGATATCLLGLLTLILTHQVTL